MGREPPSQQRRVALIGIDVDLVGSVFAVTVNNVLAVERVVIFERFARSKAVRVDSERLLLVVSKQESDRRCVCGFRRDQPPLVGATINEDGDGWLVAVI